MKKYNLFSLLMVLLLFSVTKAEAALFQEGIKYRLEAFGHDVGAVSLGSFHNSKERVYYLDSSTLTEDCWWYIDSVGENQWRIRNAMVDSCLTFTGKKDYVTCERLEPTIASDSHGGSYWYIGTYNGRFQFIYKGNSVDQFISLPNNKLLVIADKYDDDYTLFNIYDESGNKVSTDGAGTAHNIPDFKNNLYEWADSIRLNGRDLVYVKDDTQWMAVIPEQENTIVISFIGKVDGITIGLYRDDNPINSVSELSTNNLYDIIVKNGAGNEVARASLVFTTLPILDIRHIGTIRSNMNESVLGIMRLTSATEPSSVILPSKFKSRGATASTWEKHSMNMKLRDFDTGAEIDSTLLGLRCASSWILDAMAIDRIKMRNRVCFDVWNDYSKLPYYSQFDSRNGTVGRFVEVIDNGSYCGIYCLTDRINRKLLNLKKPEMDDTGNLKNIRGVLYKSNMWDYTGLVKSQMDDYVKIYGDTRDSTLWCNWELAEPEDYPCPEAWAALDSLYFIDHNDVNFIRRRFYLQNMADWQLLVLAFCMEDNGNKNEFLSIRNIQKNGEDNSRYLFTPWDMDASLGGRYDGEVYFNGTYSTTAIDDMRIMKNYPFSVANNMNDYKKIIANRWFEISRNGGALSLESVSARMEAYATLFVESGAWERELSHWNKYNQLVDDVMQEVLYIENWYANRIKMMDDYFLPNSSVESAQGLNPINTLIYDMWGNVVTDTKNLKPGLYISDGTKFLVK